MFSTAFPPSQYVTLRSTTSPPALHNARYSGWVQPPIQLPSVALTVDTSSRHPHEVTTTNELHPYTIHPYTNSGAPASADTIGHADSQLRNVSHSWTWNGVPETRTTAQHDTENAGLIHGHFTRRMMPSNLNTQKAFPHPFLAPPSVSLIYDLRHPPTSLRFPQSSPFVDCGYESLRVPLTPERPKQIRIINPYFPWAFDLGPSAGEEAVTCLDVLSILHAALQRPLTDTEWGAAGDDKRASLIRARNRRLRIQPALHRSSNPAAHTRPTVSFERPVPRQREPLLLRVDWLGSSVAFMGLVKDEAFARKRFVPGGRKHPETWMVKFQIL
ncbi:uncharacterized protein F5147DRAFT_314465 [Suillus discolor]|uniref:DUF6699 domain-containing protein n=1 Tax=Suillus discolor TaxID=1912936 RepID=A0A9P7F0F6_9AGAM|nr:uncharacterized protein F5147DRAFT_314465 [Suillus discolor]KAG2101313.1 hypothetical protein F5147DRAFT_314465 [Suillus discolor]